MLKLIEGGEIYAPEPLGKISVLIDHDKIIKVGAVDKRGLDILGLEYETIDATNCYVTPAFIDAHQHLLGGSGEGGLNTQTPTIFLSEIVTAGITTVVGVLGVDTTMKTMAGLLGRVKGLKEDNLSTRMWSGGYNVPPISILRDVREDIMFIDEIIGAGEIAISDKRSLQPDTQHLARVVLETHIGGMLSGKAGLTHFHVGEEDSRLQPLRDLLENFDIEPAWLYPTHVTRSEKLFDEALQLVKKGAAMDTDTIVKDVPKWIKRFLEKTSDRSRMTISSDAGESSPRTYYEAFCSCVLEHKIPIEVMLPFCTSNPADILELKVNGRLCSGNDANVLVMRKDTLEIREVISIGKRLLAEGTLKAKDGFLKKSNRQVQLHGEGKNEE